MSGAERRQCRSHGRLDIDVNENEPLFIDASEEILQEDNVPESNRTGWIEPPPVVQRIRSIGKNRWTTETLGDCVPRNSDTRRKMGCWRWFSPDVRMYKIRQEHHDPLKLTLITEWRTLLNR